MSISREKAVQRMVNEQLRARGIADEAVLRAMASVPRDHFVPHQDMEAAYSDRALPTRGGQTISQPYVVALMTQLLNVQRGMKVLEIGTGSGYQTAILASLGAHVVSIERSAELTQDARQALTTLGLIDRVKLVTGDGSMGNADEAPYDRILVTAGAPSVPQPLKDQLADGGRIVIPIGSRREELLMAYDREGDDWRATRSIGVRFVPLIGEAGWREHEVG